MYGNGTIVCWKCLWPVDSLMDFLVLGAESKNQMGINGKYCLSRMKHGLLKTDITLACLVFI